MSPEKLAKEQRLKEIHSIVQPKYYDVLLRLVDRYENDYWKL